MILLFYIPLYCYGHLAQLCWQSLPFCFMVDVYFLLLFFSLLPILGAHLASKRQIFRTDLYVLAYVVGVCGEIILRLSMWCCLECT